MKKISKEDRPLKRFIKKTNSENQKQSKE